MTKGRFPSSTMPFREVRLDRTSNARWPFVPRLFRFLSAMKPGKYLEHLRRVVDVSKEAVGEANEMYVASPLDSLIRHSTLTGTVHNNTYTRYSCDWRRSADPGMTNPRQPRNQLLRP